MQAIVWYEVFCTRVLPRHETFVECTSMRRIELAFALKVSSDDSSSSSSVRYKSGTQFHSTVLVLCVRGNQSGSQNSWQRVLYIYVYSTM